MIIRLLRFIKTTFLQFRRRLSWFSKSIFIARGSYVHPLAKIGDFTRINYPSHIGECTIGKVCAIGGRLVIRSSNHSTAYLNMQDHFQKKIIKSSVKVAGYSSKKVSIGNGVWIGDSVIILPNVHIGNGAVIGAGSVVTKDIPPYSIAVGNPARVIKFRFEENKRNILESLEWWNWSAKQLKAARGIFECEIDSISDDVFEKMLRGVNEEKDC